jgi:hypothetical protein
MRFGAARRIAAGWATLLAFGFAGPCLAQRATRAVQPELRADIIVARATAGELAAGAVVPVGEYLRLGGDVGAGLVVGDRHGPRAGARLDAYGRFHLDPFGEARWAPYLVGGGSFRADARARGHLYLLTGLGVEGPTTGHVVPAFEIGLGGGVRIGVVLRRPARGGSAR